VVDLYHARVLDSRPEAEAQVFLTLEVRKEVWTAHRLPAQYVDLVLGEMEPWHGTVANRPGRETFDFIIKDVGERSHEIASLKAGDEILTSLPQGPGFPALAHRGHNLILIASGVAICAMRPVIEEILLDRGEWGRVQVLYGERTDVRFAFVEERERWRESGIEVYLSASRPGEGTYWRGHVGYVQDHLLELVPDMHGTVAFIAGRNDMIEGVRRALGMLGLPENRVLLNYEIKRKENDQTHSEAERRK